MGLTTSVVTGEIIESAWGNEIRDRTIQVFANVAERDLWLATRGCWAFVTDTGNLYMHDGTAWGPVYVDRIIAQGNMYSVGTITTPTDVSAGRVIVGGALGLDANRVWANGGVLTLQEMTWLSEARLSAYGLHVKGKAAAFPWSQRPLISEGPLGAIAMHSTDLAIAGSIHLYTSATHFSGFHTVNGDNSGYFSTHSGAFTVVSKRSAKTDIEPWVGDSLAICESLQPVTYKAVVAPDLEGNVFVPQTMIGLIADEVVSVVPEVVVPDVATGEPEGIIYDSLVPVLVDAIKQLTARVAALEGAP